MIEIEPASKALYFAGVQCAAQLVLPWIAGAVELLRATGFSRLEATELAQAVAGRALRSYCKGGPKAWNAAMARELQHAVERGREELHRREARLAALHEAGIQQAMAFFAPIKPPQSERRLKPLQRAQARATF